MSCNHLIGYDGGYCCPSTELVYADDPLTNYPSQHPFGWCPLCGEALTEEAKAQGAAECLPLVEVETETIVETVETVWL